MNRIIPLLFLLSSAPCFARQRISGYCEKGGVTAQTSVAVFNVTPAVQGSYPSCTVTVFASGTTNISTVYADDNGTSLANPFTAATDGYWFFYADDGKYDVQFSGTISPTFTRGDAQPLDYRNTYPGSGAVARPFKNKVNEYLSVKDFGAIGDGVSDDTLFIQAAIDSAALTGKGVFLPAATYGITAPLVARTNTNLLCEAYGLSPGAPNGAPTTRIKSLASWTKRSGDAILTNDRSTYSFYTTIKNCTLEGNATSGPDYGIYFLDGNTLTMEDVLVNISRLDGVFLDNDGLHTAQSATLTNVVVLNAVQNSGLAAKHAALHVEWTDVVLNAVYPTTSSEATYSEGGKRIACWAGLMANSGAMSNCDCSHSEVGVRIDANYWRVSNSRSEFSASDGWQVAGNNNMLSSVFSEFDGRATTATYAGFNVTGAGNVFSSPSEVSLTPNYQPKYGMYFANSNNPPNVVFGNVLGGTGYAGFVAEVSTTDPTHLVWDGYRQIPSSGSTGGGWTPGVTGAIDVTKIGFLNLSNGSSGPYTITALNSGVPGQRVTFIYSGNANPPSILTTSSIFLTKAWTPNSQGTVPHASLTLQTPDGTSWFEVARDDYGTGTGPNAGIVTDTAETTNNRYWDFSSNTGFEQLFGRACADGGAAPCTPWVQVQRSGTGVTAVSFPARAVVGPGANNGDGVSNFEIVGEARSDGLAFANLGTPSNGTFVFCNNCNVATPCTGGGSGAWAFRTAATWKCPF